MICSRMTPALVLSCLLIACDDGLQAPTDAAVIGQDASAADAGDSPEGDAAHDEQPEDGGDTTDAAPDDSDAATCVDACVHGDCGSGSCVCHPGFVGAECDALALPGEQGMLLWFDADHDDSFEIAAAQQVDSWSARYAVDGPVVASADEENHRPVRGPFQLNGRPTVVFDGANDSLSTDGDGFTFWSGLDGVESYTLFAVYQATLEGQIAFAALSNAHGMGMAVGTGGRDGQVEALHGDATAAADVFPLQLVSQDNAIVLTDYNLVVLRVTQTTATLRVNGEESAMVALPEPIELNIAQSVVNLGVDSIFYPDDRYLGGGLAEIILYAGGLGSTDVEHVETYLQAKWGL